MSDNNRIYSSPLYAPFEATIVSPSERLRGEEYDRYQTNKAVRKKIDKLLHENHLIQQEIDKYTTKQEKEEINKRSEAVLEKIRLIAPDFFTKIAE